MDTRIANSARPDIAMIESAPRPTPTPTRINFGQVLAAGMNGIVQGAELAASVLPGSAIAATAVRGGLVAPPLSSPGLALGTTLTAAAEGPGGSAPPSLGLGVSGASGGAADPSGTIDASLAQSAQLNLYYLQIQQEVDGQNRTFTALSNVLKTEHDTAKGAIGNIHA
jgi:hypothetical protein